MNATFLDHLVFLVLAVVLPLEGRRRYRSLLARDRAGQPDARIREYRSILVEEWLACAAVGALWLSTTRSVEQLGLVPRAGTPALIGYALTAAAVALLIFEGRRAIGSPERRAEVRKALGAVRVLIPQREEERRLFIWVGATAGICEEILYRGFLFFYLATWLPEQPKWIIVLVGGAIFGFAHLYQGKLGVLRTGVVGVVLGALYWLTGSIWAPMALHAVIDLNSGWVGWKATRE